MEYRPKLECSWTSLKNFLGGKFFGPVLCRKHNLVIRVFWCCHVFCERKDWSRALYSSLIIVKSLQLCGRKQIAESCKYCLMHMIVFFWRVFFFLFFFFSHRLGIQVNSLHTQLVHLALDSNGLCGSIPSWIYRLMNLETLDLYFN